MRSDPFFDFWLFRQIQEDMEEEDRARAKLLEELEDEDDEDDEEDEDVF